MKEKVNYELGRVLYHSIVDANGYPNGLPYWEEMEPAQKYHYCALAIDFLEKSEPVVHVAAGYGFEERPEFGEGECKSLMDYIEERAPKEKEEFEKRLKMVQDIYNRRQENKDVVDTQSAGSPDEQDQSTGEKK